MNNMLRKAISYALAAVMTAGLLSSCGKEDMTAISMRLQRMVGSVSLKDNKGQEKTLAEQMRLESGNRLSTGAESLVMVSLDETKLITMEEKSNADIKASGKNLEFDVKEGSAFINVTEKLSEDQTFTVRSGNMICGVRGTSLYVGKDAQGQDVLIVTDGDVEAEAENPVTKEREKRPCQPVPCSRLL